MQTIPKQHNPLIFQTKNSTIPHIFPKFSPNHSPFDVHNIDPFIFRYFYSVFVESISEELKKNEKVEETAVGKLSFR